MLKSFFVSFLILCVAVLTGQTIERKIIIQNGNYYFTTIHDENQLATLHTGKISEPLKDAKKLATPVGRNYNEPVIPFAWDLVDTCFYGISFLQHPLNDRFEAIKRMLVSSLKPSDKVPTPMELINLSVDMNPYAYNDPYAFVTNRSNILEGFFFDAIAPTNLALTMVITNNGELTIWHYSDGKWQHSEVMKFPVNGYFSLFERNKKTYLITNDCAVYEVVGLKLSPVKTDGMSTLKDGTLVVNKDEKKVYYIKNNDINTTTPLSELIKKKGIDFLKNTK